MVCRFFTVIVIIVLNRSHYKVQELLAAMSQQPVVPGSVNSAVAEKSTAAEPVGQYPSAASSHAPPLAPQQSAVTEKARTWYRGEGHERWETTSAASQNSLVTYHQRSDIRSDATKMEVGDVGPRNSLEMRFAPRTGTRHTPNLRREPLRRRVWEAAEGI